MPPPQCPTCGRFLSKAFVLGLREAADRCPRCDTRLTDEHFAPAVADRDEPPPAPAVGSRTATTATSATTAASATTATTADERDRDVLASWDRDVAAPADRADSQPPLTDITDGPTAVAIVIGAGVLGGLLGGLALRRDTVLGAVVGTLAGAGAALVGTRLVGLPEPPGIGHT